MTDWDQLTYEALQEDTAFGRVTTLEAQVETLRESLEDATRMLQYEDRGWSLIGQLVTGEHTEGLTLDELKQVSGRIRPRVALEGLVKRGVDLHTGYIHAKGMNIAGIEAPTGRGRPSGVRTFYIDPVNQESIFSPTAKLELQKARYSDGNVYLLCDPATRTVRRIPLNDITGVKVNPDFPEEVWMYQRTWNPQTRADGRPIKRWYYTNKYKGTRQKSVTQAGETVPVGSGVIVDKRFNRQVGYPLGIPDALPAMPWIAAYEEIIQYGRVVNESLSKILYKIISKTKAGVSNSAVKVAGMSGYGNAASMMEGQDVQAISTAGKGYDFAAARPVAAMAATALNVPNAEFLGDSSAAGSSYGALSALAPSTKNAMRIMQDQWTEMYEEVFKVFDIPVPRIWWDSMEDIDPYRKAQQIKLLSDGLSDEEYRGIVLDEFDIEGNPSEIPDVLKMRSATGTAAQQSAPDQGRSNGSGGGGQGANDLRSDGIGESLRQEMALDDLISRLSVIIERAETSEKP